MDPEPLQVWESERGKIVLLTQGSDELNFHPSGPYDWLAISFDPLRLCNVPSTELRMYWKHVSTLTF